MKKKNSMQRIGTAAVTMILVLFFVATWVSCKNNAKASTKPAEHHDATLMKPDGSAIYIDAIPNQAVMKNSGSDTGSSKFYSFRIGLVDSMIVDKKQEMLKQRYYDFEMEQDWITLINGDSLRPVFFHPQVQKTTLLKEFIMVFEVPAAFMPDTFIYKDRNRREINTIVLNRK